MANRDVTVYMIGNAHIDPVWLWRWQEGFAEVIASCRSALDRLNEYPEFVFTRADAGTYKWIEDSCPQMFEEIKARVAEGRWSIVGGWWEQPDCNIPSGESFVRHELYAKRYFLEKFGVDVNVGYNVDSFGHNAGLPQILSKAGIDHYVFMRPEQHEKELPDSMFYWVGPDGSRVLTYRLQGPYCTQSSQLGHHLTISRENGPKTTGVAGCFYGVGNHGGGPTIENIECIKRMQADPDGPTVVFGSLSDMFEHALRQRGDFPVVEDDLQHHAIGCYTAHSGIKMWNRKAENSLVNAEKFCALAKIASGRSFPKSAFEQAWKKVLFNQFHDILAGTSLDTAYDDVRDGMGAAIETADYETTTALTSLAYMVDSMGEGEPFLAFNPHPYDLKCAIQVDENPKSLRDHTGRDLPVQAATPFFKHTGTRETKIFVDTLPALGYKLYYAGAWDSAPAKGMLQADESSLENDRYRLQIDPVTGDISRLFDKINGEMLAGPAGAVVMDDPSDTWSHDIARYDQLAGRFSHAKLSLIENGPVRATIRVETTFGESTLTQDISLYAELPTIEINVTVDWQEKHRVLKLEYPLNLQDPVAAYDAAYAVTNRPTDGAENPGQKWIDVTGKSGGRTCGVSLINNGKYGFDVEGATMRLSAVRSPIYAFHVPRQIENGCRYHYMDQGVQSFKIALLPHAGSWQDAGTVREALVANMPPVAIETCLHKGEWPGEQSFGAISQASVDVCAIKEAEDGNSLIVRLYETSGKATNATLTLAGASYPVKMGAFELKTLKIKDGKATEVDLIERG